MALDFDHVQKPIRKIRKPLKKIDAQASSEQVHEFRRNCRRLESMLEVLGKKSDSSAKRVLMRLARFRKRAGEIRDMDVLTGYAADNRQPKDEHDCEVQLLEYLGAKRRKYASGFHELRQKEGREPRRRLKRLQNQLAKTTLEAQQKTRPRGRERVPRGDSSRD